MDDDSHDVPSFLRSAFEIDARRVGGVTGRVNVSHRAASRGNRCAILALVGKVIAGGWVVIGTTTAVEANMLRGFVLGVIVTVIVLAAIIYVALSSGWVPANADATPSALEIWATNLDLEATLKRNAPQSPNPVPLTEANLIDGVTLYGRYCAACHGTAAGNAARTPIALGEYPSPPQLGTDGVEDDPEGVTFWKIDHGIRLTGMPSWRKTLTERQMWTLALFLKHMDKLPPAADSAWKSLQLPDSPAKAGAGVAPG